MGRGTPSLCPCSGYGDSCLAEVPVLKAMEEGEVMQITGCQRWGPTSMAASESPQKAWRAPSIRTPWQGPGTRTVGV